MKLKIVYKSEPVTTADQVRADARIAEILQKFIGEQQHKLVKNPAPRLPQKASHQA